MKVLFVSSGNKEFNISPFVSSQGKSLENNGVVIDYFIIQGKGLIGYLKNIPILRKKIKMNGYDVIHSHYSFSGWISVLTFCKVPQVLSFMGTDVYGNVDEKGKPKLKGKINYFISKLIQPFVNQIIVKSKRLGNYVYLKNKMHVVPNGVDFERFKPVERSEARDKINLISNKKQILFLGNKNNARKNYALLKNAFEYLNSSEYDLLPFEYPVEKELIPYYINSADVVIMTSYLEGSPNVVKEAMACNIPVVSVDVGDVPEIIEKTQGCYIVEYEAKNLSDKIKKACTFKNTSGRKDISHLEINNVANTIIKIYNKAKGI